MSTELPLVWIDGHILRGDDPVVTATDHGLLMGDGVFEALIARAGSVVMADRHLRRLRRGLDRLDIVGAPDDTTIIGAIEELVAASGLAEARLRITITPGPGPSPRQRGDRPTTIVSIDRLASAPRSASLTIVPWVRNERSPLAGIKSTAWSENAFALRHATAAGFDNALFLDSTGRLSECATANIFVVIDDAILTPTLDAGCLAGTVREALLEIGVAHECDLRVDDLDRADAVFITTSTTGVVPIVRIDDRAFDATSPAIDRARAGLADD